MSDTWAHRHNLYLNLSFAIDIDQLRSVNCPRSSIMAKQAGVRERRASRVNRASRFVNGLTQQYTGLIWDWSFISQKESSRPLFGTLWAVPQYQNQGNDVLLRYLGFFQGGNTQYTCLPSQTTTLLVTMAQTIHSQISTASDISRPESSLDSLTHK
jgi:hypothetical protein